MTITLITVSPDDWRTWRSLRLAALADAPEAFGSRLEDWADADENRWRDRLSIPGAIDLVALDSRHGRPVGMITGTPPTAGGDGAAELISMWVDPAARGQGVATLLIGAVADWVAANGTRHLKLSVMSTNDSARRTYGKNGFEIIVDPDDGHELKMMRVLDLGPTGEGHVPIR